MAGRILFIAFATVVFLCGCQPRGPMTDKEFMGFCAGADGRRGNCDSLGLCDEYLKAVGTPQKGLQECLQGCSDVEKQLASRNRAGRCQATIKAGHDWCQRYCRTLYPE